MNLAGKRVLLVEDEVIIGFALDDMISDEGAQTTLVASRADAERALAETDYDLAIIDVNLNGDLSYPLADVLTEKGCPFIFATGYGNVTHPDRFAKVPTVGKPYNLATIMQATTGVL
ncbi:response regulator [Erythrobacter sp. 3-20A1M]|uniref:response regulator n=1 Tax=Erythrobacter sp. 3-20A1M TaxID=2653850 RepID=UPI001BFC8E13|nr:response regulator [Erythrobacter sp. 3-20A1M]QWC56022.1 response regulator [Erythrobacter sp. 3-20A1M]